MCERPEAIRSRHPAFSIAAIGKHAGFLTRDHDENAPGFLPYRKLTEMGGKALFIGLGGRLVSLRHEAQGVAGLLTILPPRWGVRFRRRDGSTDLYVMKEDGCTTSLPDLNPEMQRLGLLKEGRIGQADSLLADAAGVVSHMAGVLKESPEMTLCPYYRARNSAMGNRVFKILSLLVRAAER
jgi:aminoglycoside 3-N-acetyltransferase